MTDDAMKKLRELINELLNQRRPDRYTLDGTDEDGVLRTQFLADIADEIEPLIPDAEARQLLANQLVMQQESKATRNANRLFRHLERTGDLPLFWADAGSWPLAVVSPSPDDPAKTIEERVALRATTPDDGRAFANEERRRAAKDFAARNAACMGAEHAAHETDLLGLPYIWDYFKTLGGDCEDPEDDDTG